MDTIELEHLIKLAAEGDMGAFEAIYKSAGAFVYGIALRYGRCEADAKDIAQQAFLKIHANLLQFKTGTSFKAWVYRITVNSALNSISKKKKDGARDRKYSEEKVVETVRPVVLDRIRHEDARQRLAELLELLSEEQKECLMLREIDGLSYREIAEVLDENINTVRARLRRARLVIMDSVNGKGASHEM